LQHFLFGSTTQVIGRQDRLFAPVVWW